MSQWQEVKERIAGKWQVPILLLSLILLPVSLVQLRPPPSLLSSEEAVEQINEAFAAKHFEIARELGDLFLNREPEEITVSHKGQVHLLLARSEFQIMQRRRVHSASDWHRIADHSKNAVALDQQLEASDFETWGRAFEGLGNTVDAITSYNEALALGATSPWDLRKHILELKFGLPHSSLVDLGSEVDTFLSGVMDQRLDLRLWAIEKRLELLEDQGNLEDAATLLAKNRQYFANSDLQEHFQYLEGWLHYSTGKHAEAELILRAVRNRVAEDDPVYAMSGWLLGRAVLSDGEPQRPIEALSFFEDVIIHQPTSSFAIASRLGRAEALAMLERHDEALSAYRTAMEEIDRLGARPPLDLPVLRTSLGLQAENQRQNGRLAESVGYAEMAVSLLDPDDAEQSMVYLQQLGHVQQLLAEQLDQANNDRDLSAPPVTAPTLEARTAFQNAADTFDRLARLTSLSESRAASASWTVAELLARAGERARAVNLYAAFGADRPDHPLSPRALLRIGQLQQASGQFALAIEAYRECYRRFPRLLDSSRGLVPMAQCYMALGSDQLDMAEKTLRIVLSDSEIFTPQAPEFADALFLLAEVLHRRGRFEQAIAAFEEPLERYPDDPRGARARFLLADSFRQSGLALKAEVANARYAEEMQQLRTDGNARFASARKLFRLMINEYELLDPEWLTRAQRVYLRYARLYEADCAFEVQDYREALKLYEQTVGLYQDTPSALAAYVQIINSHVFLGEPEEARAALARARVLVKSIPSDAFTSSVAPEGRDDWERYFEWLERSELF